jgi:hypothetical protein
VNSSECKICKTFWGKHLPEVFELVGFMKARSTKFTMVASGRKAKEDHGPAEKISARFCP